MNNLLIKGDSTIELKKLNQEFKNKINMIYIDPPYNTNRKDLQYYDNRELKNFKELLYITLQDSCHLLKETGNIFLSINSKNSHIVRTILDEIYGKENYQATIIRKENAKKQKIGKPSLKENYELVIVYSKNKLKSLLYTIVNEEYKQFKNNILMLEKIKNKNVFLDELLLLKINNINLKELKILKKIWSLCEQQKGLTQYKYIEGKEIFRAADINMYLGKNNDYNLIHPITKKICNKPKYGYPNIKKFENWILKNNNLIYNGDILKISKNKLKCGNIILNNDEKKIPDFANKLDLNQLPDTIINITGSDDRYLTKLFGEKVFDYPKPLKLLDYLIKIGTKENDLILDFFAGSGTTAESAFKLKRNFIIIQKPDLLNNKLKNEENKNLKNLFDITEKRLQLTQVKVEKRC